MNRISCSGDHSPDIQSSDRLISGTVGAVCEFTFDSVWDGLGKTAVFRAGNTICDAMLTADQCVIPWEVLSVPGIELTVGVYGTNDEGTKVITTEYVSLGLIYPGADPSGDESTDPTLPVWAQLQTQIGDLDELETNAKDNLIDAINEAAQSGGHTGGSGGSGGSGESSTIDVHTQALSPTSAHENGGTQVDFDVEAGGAISRTSVQLWNGNDGSGEGGDDESAELEYIASVTVSDEDVNSVEFTLDKDGLPFSLTKFAIAMGATQTPSDFWSYGDVPINTGTSNTMLYVNEAETPGRKHTFYNIGVTNASSRSYKWFFEKKNGRWFVITAPNGAAWSLTSLNDVNAMFGDYPYSKAKTIKLELITSTVYIRPGVTIGLFGIRG